MELDGGRFGFDAGLVTLGVSVRACGRALDAIFTTIAGLLSVLDVRLVLLRLLWVRCQIRCAIVTVAVVALPLICRSRARRLKTSERCILGLPLEWLGAVAVFVQPLAIMQD